MFKGVYVGVENQSPDEWKVGWGAYVSLIFAILFFSGLFMKVDGMEWLGALDFTTLS